MAQEIQIDDTITSAPYQVVTTTSDEKGPICISLVPASDGTVHIYNVTPVKSVTLLNVTLKANSRIASMIFDVPPSSTMEIDAPVGTSLQIRGKVE